MEPNNNVPWQVLPGLLGPSSDTLATPAPSQLSAEEDMLREAMENEKSGTPARSREILENLVVIRPEFRQGWERLGRLLMSQKNFGAAVMTYRQFAQRFADDYRSHNALGMALVMAGLPEQALEPMDRAVQLSGREFQQVANLGKLQMMLENWAAAETLMAEALAGCQPGQLSEFSELLELCRQAKADKETSQAAAADSNWRW